MKSKELVHLLLDPSRMVSELPPRGSINWDYRPDGDYKIKAANFAGQIKRQLSGTELSSVLQHKLTTEEIDYIAGICGETAALSQGLLEVNATLRLKFSQSVPGCGHYEHKRRTLKSSVSQYLNPLIARYREVEILGDSRIAALVIRELGLRWTIAHECYHQDTCFRFPKSADRSIDASLLYTGFGLAEDYLVDRGESAAELFAQGLLRKQVSLEQKKSGSQIASDSLAGKLAEARAALVETAIARSLKNKEIERDLFRKGKF